MNFKDVIELLISSYGITGLIISVLIIILFIITPYMFNKSNKNINKGLEKMAEEISKTMAAQNQNLIESLSKNESKMIDNQMKIIDMIIRHDNEDHLSRLDQREQISINIQDKINYLKVYYDCARVIVLEFHNSKGNLNGLPFKWYDIIYESQARGVMSISSDSQNLPSSLLIPIIKRMNEDDIVILDKENIQKIYDESPVLYDYLSNKLDADCVIYVPLYNINDRLIGMVAVEFSNSYQYDLKSFDPEEMIMASHYISSLLEVNKATSYKQPSQSQSE